MPSMTIQQAYASAVQHHQAGRLQQAEQIYRQILAQQPARADALHLLGLIAYQVGRHEAAVDLIRPAWRISTERIFVIRASAICLPRSPSIVRADFAALRECHIWSRVLCSGWRWPAFIST